MNKITVTNITVEKNRLTINFKCTGQIRKFFNQNTRFIVEYDTSIEDVPETLLTIPFLATVTPIAWANQADIYVKNVDAAFLDSLESVRQTLKRFYPKMKFEGKIISENITSFPANNFTRKMALFSGGIDSLATFIRHQEEKPLLVSVQDAHLTVNHSLSRDYEWMNVASESIKQLFKSVKPEIRLIKSNWMYVPNFFSLGIYEQKILGAWYLRVMHGLAFIGLCAPLAFVEKVDKLYIASSHTADVQIPCGSHPDIDNNVRWTGIKIEHDGYELSRQEKVFLMADFIRKKEPTFQIIACNNFSIRSKVGIGKNCNNCEKCNRTILGLEIAGLDPNEHGFSVNSQTFFQMKDKIETQAWPFGDDEVYMWSDLRKFGSHARNIKHKEAQEFLQWLKNVNIESLRTKHRPKIFINSHLMILPYPVLKLTEKFYYLLIIKISK